MKPVIDATKFNTIRALEWALVVMSGIQVAYVLSPVYKYSLTVNGATPFRAALANPAFVYVFIIGLLISSVILAYGLKSHNDTLISIGLFSQTLLRFFNITVTIVAFGILPLTWIYPATVVLFCVILWFHHKVKKVLHAS